MVLVGSRHLDHECAKNREGHEAREVIEARRLSFLHISSHAL